MSTNWTEYDSLGQTLLCSGTMYGIVTYDYSQQGTLTPNNKFYLPTSLTSGNWMLSLTLCDPTAAATNINKYALFLINYNDVSGTNNWVNTATLSNIAGTGSTTGFVFPSGTTQSLSSWYITVPQNSSYQLNMSLVPLTATIVGTTQQ